MLSLKLDGFMMDLLQKREGDVDIRYPRTRGYRISNSILYARILNRDGEPRGTRLVICL